MTHDVSREARDARGRWAKTPGEGAFSDWNVVDQKNLKPPTPPFPALPAQIDALLKRMIALPNREYHGTGVGETIAAPGDTLLTVGRKMLWELRRTPPEQLKEDLKNNVIDIAPWDYQSKYGGSLDDALDLLVQRAQEKLTAPSIEKRFRAKIDAGIQVQQPKNLRWQSVSQVANATNQDISTLTGQYAERIRPYVGGLSYFPYDLFDVARENFNTSAPGSSEWEQKTLKMWRKMVSERQGRDAFHQGKEQYDDKGLVAGYIGDGPYDSLPLDERMEYLAQELHAWGQRADEQIQFLQQAYRKRYRSIIDAAQKAYRDAYSEGATTAGNWVKMLTAKYAVNDDAAKLVTPAWIVDKTVVGDDYPVVLDAFRALPLSDAVREKLSKQTTSVKVESDPQKLYGGSRASYSPFRGITLAPSDESEVVDHEYGHHIEHVLNLGPALKQWVIDRATYMPVRMGQPYGNSEMAYPDKFITKYVGKSYPGASTEVLSMGIQAALTHPDDFMKVDPEHFFLTMGVLLGLGETMNTADPVFPRPTEKSEDVKKPGSRGGHPWLDEHGHWRYDQQPAPEFGKTLEETIHNYRLAQRRALQRKDKTAAKQYDAYASLAEAAAYKPYALNSYQEMATDPVEGYNLPKQDVATFVATLRKQPRSPLPDTILSPAAKATVVRAIKAIKDRPIEHLVVVDPSSGRVLDALKGSPSQVGRHGSRPYYGTIHIHNHPAELYAKNEPTVSFSRDDILAAAKRGAAMIMAVGRDGKVYIMQPPQGRGWNTSFYMDKILPAWEQADAELESTKGSDYKEGGLADSVDRTWKMVAAKTGIRYTVTSLSALEQDAAMAQTAQVTSPAPVSAWKPLMTEQEAEQWSAHSAYKQPVWHVTTPEAAKEIREHGFTLGNEVSFGSEFGAGIYLATDDATKKYYEDRIRERGQEPVVLEGRVNVHHVLKLNMAKMPSADDWDNSGISGVAKQLPGGRKRFTQECQKYYQQWNEKVYAKVEEKYPMGSVSKQRPGEEETAWRERLNKYREKREQYQQYLTRKFHMVGWNDSAYVEAKVIRDMLLQAGYDAVYVQMRPEDYDTGDWAMETIGGSQIMVTDPDDVTVAAKSFDFRHPSKKLQFLLMFLADQYATVDNVDQRPLARSFGAWLWRHGRDLVKAVADQPASGADQPASQVGQSGGDQPVKSQMHDPIPAGSRWITVHPNGSDEPGHPVLIMPAHGRKNVWHIIGGAGGRLTHMEIHLNSPEEWKQHAIERAKARKEQEVQAGVTPDNKAALKRAKEESQRLYVKRVAERMGWQDYSDKTADDFLAQAKGNKTQAALLAHQYLRSYVSKANEAMKNLRTRLAVDKDAFAGANLRLASGDTDPYRADENDLIPGDISQRLTESQNLGNHEAVGYYQQALDALKGGDTEAAKTYLTAGNKAAGIRGLTVQDVLPQENVQQPTGAETAGKQAKEQIQASGALAPEALQQRIDAATALAKSGNEADKYTSQLELDALKQAQEQAGGDPTKTDMKGAAKAYLQAEKFRAIREKLKGDTGKFQAWKGMREQAIANAAGVRALRNQGKFGADGVDPDVADMAAARDLLAAKVLYDNRMRQIKQAQQSLDPQLMHTVVQDKDVLESDATWDDVYNQAQKQAQADIEQAKETATAADLDVATDNPTNFLRAVGEGEPVDQQHIQRYIHFGQQSALDVIGENAGGAPLLPVTAYRALGVKGASKLMANYLAATRKPEEFNALKEGIGNYHAAREFDVANGALVAANAVLAAAKEYKREEDANVDNLYEAAKYNKLRLEAVDHALATIGTAYGELNATAEMNYALMAAKPGAQNLVIDGEGRDAGQLVALAHALNLDPADYRLVDQQKAKGGTAQPRGLELTTSGVGKLFHEATPAQKDRRARLMSIRAGDQDDLMPDGSKATNGWLPPYFANWPATLRNTQTAPVAKDEQTLDKQTLQGNPQETLKAVAYALGEQPFATVAFKDNLDADDIKLLQAFYASRRGIPVEQPKENQEYVPESSAPETDIFGNPILAKTAAGKASDDKASVAWRDLVHRVGAQQALQVVQNAIKSDFLTGFVPVYNTMTGQNLQVGQEKLGPKSDYARTTIGPQAEQQLTDLVQKMAWRYPKGTGAAEYAIPGISMSGRFVKQQRVIKSLDASGGLNGNANGGRLGAFLGVGCVRGDTPLYDPVRKETRTIHDWMVSGESLHVEAYDESTGKVVVALASRPFIKGYETMYAVALSNGKTMHVTAAHQFLTPQGWWRLDQLSAGSLLVADPRASSPKPDVTSQRFGRGVRPTVSRPSVGDFFPQPLLPPQPGAQASMTLSLTHFSWLLSLGYASCRDWRNQVDAFSLAIRGLRDVRGLLHESGVRHLPTSLVFVPRVFLVDVRRWKSTIQGWLGRCWRGSRHNDERLRPAVSSFQEFVPLPGDVRVHSLHDSLLGGWASRLEYSRLYQRFFRLSSQRFCRLFLRLGYWRRVCRFVGDKPRFLTHLRQSLGLFRRPFFQGRPVPECGGHISQEVKDDPSQIISILRITPACAALVYDLTVPRYHNYIVFSTIQHNSGKTNVSIGAMTNLLAENKVRQGIFAMPSAVLGQFTPAIAGVIDPNAPVNWYADPASTTASRAKAMADPNTHIVAMTHESLRDDTLKALGRLWNVPPRQAAKQFQGMTRKQRAAAVKQAFTKAGWANRFDYLSLDEGHQALNRKGKANSILANVFDAISDNSKYYMPMTGTPTRNDPSEVYDWLTKLRPDEYPPDKMQSFLARHQLLGSEVARLEAAKAADVAAGKSAQRNWTSNAAAEALQDELGENFYSSSAPIKAPVSYQNVKVALKDQPDEAAPKTDGTLPSLMQAGLQKSAYERVGQIEQAIKAAAYKQDWKQVAAGIRELTTATYKANNGKTVTRNAYTLANGQQITPGSPEEEAATKRLVTATAMMRDAAYNRVLHTMPDGNAKTKALMSILDDMGKQYAADDNQPRDAAGNPVTGDQRVKGKPVIIFTRSLDAVDNLVSTLKAHGYNALGISGRDSGADKIRKKELFQPSGKTKPRVNVLVMSDAMSAGVDLPRAEAVIHYDTGDTAKVMEQRSARAIRLSTKHPVSVYSLISDTPYEQRRVDRVARKGTLGDVVQNPAETLDDTGLGWYINQQRIAQARQQHENPTPTRPEDSLPAQGLAQAKKSDYSVGDKKENRDERAA